MRPDVIWKIKRLHAKMRNVRQQCEIFVAAFDQTRYEFCHNANLRLMLFERRAA
jgi:hypothetical protein